MHEVTGSIPVVSTKPTCESKSVFLFSKECRKKHIQIACDKALYAIANGDTQALEVIPIAKRPRLLDSRGHLCYTIGKDSQKGNAVL